MAKAMYPFSQRELQLRVLEALQSTATAFKPKKEWVRRGFFKDKPMPRHVVKLKAESARLWLRATLREPMPAHEVLELARLEGFSEWGVRRAKKHLRVKTVKTGG